MITFHQFNCFLYSGSDGTCKTSGQKQQQTMEEKHDESLLALLARCRPSGRDTLESNWTGDSGNNTMFLKPKYSLWRSGPRPHSSAPTHVEAQREPIRLRQSLCPVLKSSRFPLCQKNIVSVLYKTIYMSSILSSENSLLDAASTWRHVIGGSRWISEVVVLKLLLWEKLSRSIFLEDNNLCLCCL